MTLNGTEYFYIRNGQGDITGLIDTAGTQVVSYNYDSWGKLISIDGSLKDTVGLQNPYRYRGYRYDTETGLYYLQSRYYNPDMGRYIKADDMEFLGASGTLLGYNLFAYCENNPVNNSDPSGYIITPANLIGALIGAVGGYFIGNAVANYFNLHGWARWSCTAGTSLLLGVVGWFSDPAVYAAIKSAIAYAVSTGTLLLQKIQPWIAQFLRIVNERAINFSQKAEQHMTEAGRKVPLKTLIDAIKYGKEFRDPRGSAAMMYKIDMWKNGTKYTLEVLYDWTSRTIYHFQYYR